MEDEVRISNYAKRDFEVAASARLYSAYTQVLSREVQVSNQTAANDNFSYDLLGRVVSNQRYLISPLVAFPDAFVVRTGYDNQGRIASLRYPDGEVVVSQYDRGGTEISLTGYGDFNGTGNIYGKQPYVYAALMTVTGHLASILYGNGVKTTFRYDDGPTKNPVTGNPNSNGTFGNELLAEQLTVLPSGEVLQDQGYKYDSVGNLISRKDYGQPTSTAPPRQHSNPLKATYTYDDLNRLKSFETRFGTALAGSGNYDYDPLGNLISKEGATLEYGNQPTASLCVISFPARPPHAVTRVIQAGAKTDYCYDANGSLAEVLSSTGVVTSYKHNTRDQLVEIANSTGKFQFVYDSNGTRVYKVEPGQTPQGSISNVTTEPFPFYRITSQGIEKYYFAEGRRIARRTELPNWAVSWYHPEHLGSTNYMTDADGNELQSAYGEYIPYGGAILTADNNTAGSQDHKNTPNSDQSGGYQFNGKELDDTRLYDYGARYYDPVIGRFLEPDNVTVNMKPQGLNPYSYVLNNPLRYVDPTGHEPEFNVDKMREQFFKKVQQRLDLFRPPVYLYMVGYLDYVQSQGGFVLSGNLPLSGAAPEVSNVTSEAGMRLEYSVIREGETVFEGTISSGAGGHWGHAEMRFLDKYFDLLKPGDTVLLQGEYALCSYGLCRGALNITSLAADVDILYYGYKPYPSLTYFARGIGHVPAH